MSKCPYCDFNSHSIKNINSIPEEEYINALKIEIEQSLPLVWGRKIISVYIGGGTPSLLKASSINKIMELLRTFFNLSSQIEITIEMNPGTVDSSKIKEFVTSGINRISIGVQSFNNSKLKILGRIHNKSDAIKTIQTAQSLIDNINIDIMFALPGQNIEDCLMDLKEPILSEVNHVSMYNLTIEKNTLFAKNTPENLPDEDNSAIMQDIIEKKLFDKNIIRYEISAYSKDGFQSVHNKNYWTFGDYLGIGPGAHSKLSFQDHIIRIKRIYNPNLWIKTTMQNEKKSSNKKILQINEIPFEFMLNALRLKNGVKRSLFQERTGLFINIIDKQLKIAYEKKLLEENCTNIKATDLGWRFLNNLQEIFL
ncbi:radical SAM family heme chaperone HemW [Candidatus Kinetoplastidibacterium crithidiae]|uniref:radical SAM family heme chaperone HemW n=1 Tax=Candidatus Kinetoplastidibacterium crithidiae TaxID=33056 RepID=UPI0004B5BBE4|nr:radical SAM family heme chaperone HemW [Candidatus Kinetoplastibacterium crithidii]